MPPPQAATTKFKGRMRQDCEHTECRGGVAQCCAAALTKGGKEGIAPTQPAKQAVDSAGSGLCMLLPAENEDDPKMPPWPLACTAYPVEVSCQLLV
jgi:hypothetical protein